MRKMWYNINIKCFNHRLIICYDENKCLQRRYNKQNSKPKKLKNKNQKGGISSATTASKKH